MVRMPDHLTIGELSRRSGVAASADLELLKCQLTGCIGCGCLSLRRCALANRDDIEGYLHSGPAWSQLTDDVTSLLV